MAEQKPEPKHVYKIQETPQGEWRLTRGTLSYVFKNESEAQKAMDRMVKNNVYYYDVNGKEI